MARITDRPTFIGQVRDYMRDFPEYNALLDGEETSDGLISLCADLAADDFTNTMPPIGNFQVENHPSLYLLLLGTVIQILRSAGILQARNNLNYSDGGLTVATSDKAQIYRAYAQWIITEYEHKKRNLKISLNAGAAYGGVRSEYSWVGAYGQYIGLASIDSYTAVRFGSIIF
jgi:hypothetical protein